VSAFHYLNKSDANLTHLIILLHNLIPTCSSSFICVHCWYTEYSSTRDEAVSYGYGGATYSIESGVHDVGEDSQQAKA
jgi:hypothetical protein